jgi:diguanylate cyclase (GGDEF)-like protein/PAS domain S-box-containing protein
VVLLNSDTLVPPGWLARLRRAAYAAPDIGTATPLSNDATILSYPAVEGGNALPDLAETGRLAALAWRANRDAAIDIPTAVGFCMLIRRDVLDAVGAFDDETVALFEQLTENLAFAVQALEHERERLAHADENARFRLAMDLSADAVFVIDVESMRFLDVNERACELSGYARDALLAMAPHELTDCSRAELEAEYRALMADPQRTHVAQLGARLRGGTELIAESHRRAAYQNGRWIVVSIVRDITERRRRERQVELEHGATRELARPGSRAEVLREVLRTLCLTMDWSAAAYCEGFEAAAVLRVQPCWSAAGDAAADTSAANAVAAHDWLALLQGAETPWTPDLDSRPLRALDPLAGSGVALDRRWRARLAFPVHADGRLLGVVVGAAAAIAEPDEPMRASLRVVGDQIGQYLQRKNAERTLRRSEARFRALTKLSSDGYWEQDAGFRFVEIAQGGAGTLGLQLGRTLWETGGLVFADGVVDELRARLATRLEFRDVQFAYTGGDGQTHWTSLAGAPVCSERGEFAGYRGVSRDITERRRALRRIERLAAHDALTGVPNRARFAELLAQAMARARDGELRFALMYLDLDRFKMINDTLGHAAGDALLVEVVRRLQRVLRRGDSVGRLGGDEFVVLVADVADGEEAGSVAVKLLHALAEPLSLEGRECRVSASIGIALYPEDGADGESLMKAADLAMYLAKKDGRGRYRGVSRLPGRPMPRETTPV